MRAPSPPRAFRRSSAAGHPRRAAPPRSRVRSRPRRRWRGPCGHPVAAPRPASCVEEPRVGPVDGPLPPRACATPRFRSRAAATAGGRDAVPGLPRRAGRESAHRSCRTCRWTRQRMRCRPPAAHRSCSLAAAYRPSRCRCARPSPPRRCRRNRSSATGSNRSSPRRWSWCCATTASPRSKSTTTARTPGASGGRWTAAARMPRDSA